MQRQQIHDQIETIVGKLYQLNKYLLTSNDILEIEVDLINTYVAELNRLTALLNANKNIIAEVVVAKEVVTEVKETLTVKEPAKVTEVIQETYTAASPVAEKIIAEAPFHQEKTHAFNNDKTVEAEDEDIKFFKEEIINPIVEEVEKEAKVIEAHVKEVAQQLKNELGNKSLNELFSGSKMELADKLLHQATGKPLKDFISIGDKFMFISELFNKDLVAYEGAVKKLNEVHSFDDARNIIEHELKAKFDWDKKQDAAKHFQSILKKKFGVIDKN